MPDLDPESQESTTPVEASEGLRLLSSNGHTPQARPAYRWYHKAAGVMAAIFCFELGVFLLVFPWIDDWTVRYFSFLPLWAHAWWVSPYFRGAVSGLGLLNIYISFAEVFRLRRFSA
jgi:hypothetical protein